MGTAEAKPSTRHEECGSCGDPFFVCPSGIRHFIRCCHGCTHLSTVDVEYYKAWPGRPRRAAHSLT
jgi:hypothetical protein